ncbi:hypothetical protein C8R43DRAFT_1051284 [Mycena crocata]|nr:hypothetical protein C8R43DRAFT_1051284 [Mycena crocata]
MQRTLSDFSRNVSSKYTQLYEDLWNKGYKAWEERIESVNPDDGWLIEVKAGSDTASQMDVDSGGDDAEMEGDNDPVDTLDEGPPEVRFIPVSSFLKLGAPMTLFQHGDRAAFIVRHEYSVFFEHAKARVDSSSVSFLPIRFLVTGQPGIGKSFGCYYFLYRLLSEGQSVFLLNSPSSAYYFSSEGVQKKEGRLEEYDDLDQAVRKSWVLIDIEDNSDWIPSTIIYMQALCVIWTSSPRQPRMRTFTQRFDAEVWYMKTWTTKEIAALTARLGLSQEIILERRKVGGLVPSKLFNYNAVVESDDTLENAILESMGVSVTDYKPSDKGGISDSQPIHRVMIIEPLLVIGESGRARLQRTDYTSHYKSTHIEAIALDKMQDKFDDLQRWLGLALDTSSTRAAAGRAIEGLMHRDLKLHKVKLPSVFDEENVAGTLALIGKAENFIHETAPAWATTKRPLYLRPDSRTFAAVDAIIVMRKQLGLVQTSLGEVHDRNYGHMLRIISRMRHGAKITVGADWDLIYCLVGTRKDTVAKLVKQAKDTLERLKAFDETTLGKHLSMPPSAVAYKRIQKLRVVGYTFRSEVGFTFVA